MNKTLLIGVPVVLIAIIAIFMVMRPSTTNDVSDKKAAMTPPVTPPAVAIPAPVTVIPVAPAPAKPARNLGNVDTSSIDSISAGFLADVSASASGVVNDHSDQTAVNAQLTSYDTVKSTSYDIAI